MAIMHGDLAEYALPDLLMFLHGMRKHGQLIVEHPTTNASAGVFFDQGEVVHAYCPPREGVQALHQLLRWREGRFAFLKGAASATRTIQADLHNLLLDGLRQIDELRFFEDNLPPGNTVLHVQRDGSQVDDVRLTQVEWRFLSLVNGRRTLDQVVEQSGRDAEDAHRILYGLITSGLILTNHDDSYLGTIVAERIPAADAARTRAAPPTMLANLLVKHLDGIRTMREVKQLLGCGEADLVEEFRLLVRTGWVRISQGSDAYERYFQ